MPRRPLRDHRGRFARITTKDIDMPTPTADLPTIIREAETELATIGTALGGLAAAAGSPMLDSSTQVGMRATLNRAVTIAAPRVNELLDIIGTPASPVVTVPVLPEPGAVTTVDAWFATHPGRPEGLASDLVWGLSGSVWTWVPATP